MSRFWSSTVHTLRPYTPGEQCNDPGWIKLNTNESPLGPSESVLAALRDAVSPRLKLYPDPDAAALRAVIARHHGVEPSQVFVGNGSDEVLAHAFLALLKHPLPLLMPDIGYNFYASYCALFGIERVAVPLSDAFALDVAAYQRPSGGIVFANPNAPTGRALPLSDIASLLDANPASAVVVDEAYVDFGADTAIPLVHRHPNLLVVQTLSKSRGLAGLRVGFAIGHADLISGLERVKNSFNAYPLGSLAIAGAIAAMQDTAHLERVRTVTATRRAVLAAGLEALGFDVLPSLANFVFARHRRHAGAPLVAALRERRILVRRFAQPRIEDHLRITVGDEAQIQALLAALAEIT
ncbi:histidinol-phosphate transaminase [Ramlibacter sp.]|uniref:pyridoxal phosphate-dependent aminotransferase n=1 Tax=Ramlibacter sp. TaxID=1917967 RepID=UPI001792C64F|nr:histidinol-phosphate transaminase [Ramlibacter sp.]MBA2675448.1 histidinol-phosphate transaminase [Ramlibacter sp.]